MAQTQTLFADTFGVAQMDVSTLRWWQHWSVAVKKGLSCRCLFRGYIKIHKERWIVGGNLLLLLLLLLLQLFLLTASSLTSVHISFLTLGGCNTKTIPVRLQWCMSIFKAAIHLYHNNVTGTIVAFCYTPVFWLQSQVHFVSKTSIYTSTNYSSL